MNEPDYTAEIAEQEEVIDRLTRWMQTQARRANKKIRDTKTRQLQEATLKYQDLLNKAMEQLHFNSTQS